MKCLYAPILFICFCFGSCVSGNLNYQEAIDRNSRKLDTEEQRRDAAFLVDAADYHLLLNEMASKVSEEAYSRVVSQFATQNEQDHQRMLNQLQSVAKDKNIAVPSNIENRHQDLIRDLEDANKENIDRTYLNVLGILHERMLRIYEDAAINANDSDVRSFAAAQLDLIRSHSQKGKEIRKELL